MADTNGQEILSKNLKLNLENWRELILPLHDVLIWKTIPVHPAIIFSISTVFFLFIFFLDPTLLSFFSSLCMIGVLLDYAVPVIMLKLYSTDSWTGPKEKKLEEICSSLASVYCSFKADVSNFFKLKDSRPKFYYSIVLGSLLALSWLGNNVNNLMLTYLIVTYLLMLPGLKRSGYYEKYMCTVKSSICQGLRSITSKKEKKN